MAFKEVLLEAISDSLPSDCNSYLVLALIAAVGLITHLNTRVRNCGEREDNCLRNLSRLEDQLILLKQIPPKRIPSAIEDLIRQHNLRVNRGLKQ